MGKREARGERFWATGRFVGTDDVAEFVRTVCEGEIGDGLLAIGVDVDLRLVGMAIQHDDHTLESLTPEVIEDLADEMVARAVILVFLRGHDDAPPCPAEARRLVTLRDECERRGTGLLDGVVLTSRGYWSLRGVASMS